jgi:hypothetical protein
MISNEKIISFAIAVAEALRNKAIEPKFSYLVSVAEQLEKDLKTNLNRAMRLAMRVDIAHNLNVPFNK